MFSIIFLAVLALVECSIAQQSILWPPGPGVSLAPQQIQPDLAQMLSQIDTTIIENIIQKLVSFGTRNTLSSQTNSTRGVGAARDWIASEMQSLANASNGRLTVSVPSTTETIAGQSVVLSNIVATLKGSAEPDRVYVVSGHYDSRNTNVDDPDADAPGADDDASGVAVSMELARIFSAHDPPPLATIVFAAVTGEEQGLFGSAFMAASMKNTSMNVQGMLDNDIVGSSIGDDGTVDPFNIRMFVEGIPPTETLTQITQQIDVGSENDSPARQLGRFIAEVASNDITNMTVQTIYRPDRFLRGGDHLSFLRNGFPAVRFTEPRENFAHQHQDVRVVSGEQFGDLIEFVDFDFIARAAKVNGAALWSLAMAPGTPTNVQLDTSVLTNNSTLTWDVDANVDVEYEVVWRPSDEPMWTDVVSVGRTGGTTLLLSKDNVQFGVRAVGANGYKSPAGFPF